MSFWDHVIYVEDNESFRMIAEGYGMMRVFDHANDAMAYLETLEITPNYDTVVYSDFNGVGDIQKFHEFCAERKMDFILVSDDFRAREHSEIFGCGVMHKKEFMDMLRDTAKEEN